MGEAWPAERHDRMKESSMHVTNVTKNLQEQVVLQYMFDQYMNVKHLHVIYVKNSLHNKPI